MTAEVRVPKFTFPNDVFVWVGMVGLSDYEPRVTGRTDGSPPCVTLVRKDDPEQKLLRAWAAQLRDGLRFYVSASPDGEGTVMELALRRKPLREAKMSITAGLMAAVALRSFDSVGVPAYAHYRPWMKKAHAQILRAVQESGAEALAGMGEVFVELNRAAMKLVDRALNKDVEDSLERVRTEFRFLMDRGVEEENVVKIWREVLVDKTHER